MKKTILVILVLAFCVGLIPGIAKAKLVACVGDSITYGFGLPDRVSNCYPAQLEKILRQSDPDWQTQNFGHSGATLLRNKSASYVTKTAYSLALASEPDVVIIILGTNDVKRATRSEIEQRFIPDYLALIDDFAQLPSQPKIFVCYPPPIFPNNFGYNNSKLTDQIIPRIEQLPTYRDVEIIDLYALLENSAHLFPDGLHPNTEGARMIAETVAQAILSLRFLPDFNGDGKIDIEDLIILIEHWGTDEPLCDIAPEPFGDGVVDFLDLELLMSYWKQPVDDPTLIAHWALDETEGIIAADSVSESGYRDGIVIGDPIWQPDGGQVNGALQLDGVDDYVVTSTAPNPEGRALSVLAWIKGGAPGQVVLSQIGKASWLGTDPSTGTLMTELTIAGRDGRSLSSEAVITDGDWHRIGFVWDGSYRRLYVDGLVVAEDVQDNLDISSNGLYIGTGKVMEAGTFFSGLIDDIRIYNRAVHP